MVSGIKTEVLGIQATVPGERAIEHAAMQARHAAQA